MFYPNAKEQEIVSEIKKYGSIRKDQLKKMFPEKYKGYMENLTLKNLVRFEEDIFISPTVKQVDRKMLMALDVLTYFIDKVQWHQRGSFPFYITMSMSNGLFDIVPILHQEESLIKNILSRNDTVSRVIAVVEDVEMISNLDIDKPVRYCTLNPLKFYAVKEGVLYEEKI